MKNGSSAHKSDSSQKMGGVPFFLSRSPLTKISGLGHLVERIKRKKMPITSRKYAKVWRCPCPNAHFLLRSIWPTETKCSSEYIDSPVVRVSSRALLNSNIFSPVPSPVAQSKKNPGKLELNNKKTRTTIFPLSLSRISHATHGTSQVTALSYIRFVQNSRY